MIKNREIYLDCNATHPLLPKVRASLAQAIMNGDSALGNPSSIHRKGQKAKKSLVDAKTQLCQFLGRGEPDEFVMLSGATEALNLMLRGFLGARKELNRKVHFVCSSVDHSAVLDTLRDLHSKNLAELTILQVDAHGQLIPEQIPQTFEHIFGADPLEDNGVDALWLLQLGNNETGVIFNFAEFLSQTFARYAPQILTRKNKLKGGKYPQTPQRLWVGIDAAQSLGKIENSEIRLVLHYADYAAVSAHKMGGPSGIGALWLRPGSPFQIQITGGMQERKRRAGTLNVLGILGLRLALEEWQLKGNEFRSHMQSLTNFLLQEISKIPEVHVHGFNGLKKNLQLPNTINFHVEGCVGESLLMSLDLDGFCISSGSACNSGSLKPSHVLLAMGLETDAALSSLRVCVGVESTKEEIELFIKALREKIQQIHSARALALELLADAR